MFFSQMLSNLGSRQLMAAGIVVAMSALIAVHSAPTSLKSADDSKLTSQMEVAGEKPLIRTKRAEEIMYGNHQNAPRVKKSDPSAAGPPAPSAADEAKDNTNTDDVTKTNANSPSSASAAAEVSDGHAEAAEEQTLPEGRQDEEQEETDSANEQSNLEDIPLEADEADYPKYDGAVEEGDEEQETMRKKRSTNMAALMTAENMAVAGGNAIASRPVRAKRDLDLEELRELFENSREPSYEVGEELEDRRPVAIIPVLPETGPEDEDESEEESNDGDDGGPISAEYPYEPRYEGLSEKEELIRELVEKKAEEDAKEKLIDYLLAAAIASESEPEEDSGPATEEEEEESDDGGRYVVEAPSARQDYVDVDSDPVAIGPVAVKRNVFYPYSYEPYGGRWGALVPGSKRSSDEYERLYRLAEALNADEDYEEK